MYHGNLSFSRGVFVWFLCFVFVTLLIYTVTSVCSQQITQWSTETKIINPMRAGFKVTQKIKLKIEKNLHEFHQSNSQWSQQCLGPLLMKRQMVSWGSPARFASELLDSLWVQLIDALIHNIPEVLNWIGQGNIRACQWHQCLWHPETG